MTDWFAPPRPTRQRRRGLASLYVDQLGFTSPWRYDEDGRAHVHRSIGGAAALILADTWPEKMAKD